MASFEFPTSSPLVFSSNPEGILNDGSDSGDSAYFDDSSCRCGTCGQILFEDTTNKMSISMDSLTLDSSALETMPWNAPSSPMQESPEVSREVSSQKKSAPTHLLSSNSQTSAHNANTPGNSKQDSSSSFAPRTLDTSAPDSASVLTSVQGMTFKPNQGGRKTQLNAHKVAWNKYHSAVFDSAKAKEIKTYYQLVDPCSCGSVDNVLCNSLYSWHLCKTAENESFVSVKLAKRKRTSHSYMWQKVWTDYTFAKKYGWVRNTMLSESERKSFTGDGL